VRGQGRGQHLGQGSDLVDLHQDGVGDARLDAVAEQGDVGAEDVVADELDALAEGFGDELPTVEVVLGDAVLDRDDGVRLDECGQVGHVVGDGAGAALAEVLVAAVAVELRRGRVEGDRDVDAGV
jgi:hypothetical protein